MSKSKEHNSLLKLKTKIEITKLKINFLKNCKKNNLKPSFIQIRTSVKNNRTEKMKVMAERLWLKLEIRHHYSSLQNMERCAYELHLRVTKNIRGINDQIRWREFDMFMSEVVYRKTLKRRNTLNHKYRALKDQAQNISVEQASSTYLEGFIQNFSSIVLTVEEEELLNKGLKFCLPTIKPSIEELLVDIMSSAEKFTEEVQEEVNEASLRSIRSLKRKSRPSDAAAQMKNVARALKKKPIVISKADKSNNVVILDKDDYTHRMNTLIEDGGYEKLDKDPLNAMVKQVNQVLKAHGDVLCNDPKKELRKWKNSNPKVPRLEGYAKTHKLADINSSVGLKMRPVASNIDAPTEKIAKWLVKDFKKLKPPKGRSVKNALGFMKVVNGVVVKRNEMMGSYDAVSLFPSIPMKLTMTLLQIWLSENNVTGRRAEMYVDLTRLCMDQNIFVYNGDFYIQRDGAAIGNSLSSFLAEIYMCAFETKIENDPSFPRVYVRFVDDIFAVQNARKVNDTLKLFNGQHPRVQFTYEPEKDNKIPFLDTMVVKVNGRLEFEVFRKPCATRRVIVHDSNQEIKHKMAAFHSMAHRLVSFPLTNDAYTKERETILSIGQMNGYKTQSVERVIRKHERKKELLHYSTFYGLPRELNVDENIVRVSMTYCPEITRVLKPIYKKNNIEIVHRSGNSLRQNLGTVKDKIPEIHKSGIYKVECQDGCPYRYIGRTLRRAQTRFNEHLDDWVNDDSDSAVAAHLLKENHEIDIDKLSLMRTCQDRMRIDYMEAVYINKYKHTALMNKNLGKTSPLLVLVDPKVERVNEHVGV